MNARVARQIREHARRIVWDAMVAEAREAGTQAPEVGTEDPEVVELVYKRLKKMRRRRPTYHERFQRRDCQ